MLSAERRGRASDASQQKEQDQHNYNEPDASAGVVAPRAAVRPCRQGAERNQEQNYHKNSDHEWCRPPAEITSRRGDADNRYNRVRKFTEVCRKLSKDGSFGCWRNRIACPKLVERRDRRSRL